MPLLILIVLIVIAIILAPWLLGLIAFAIAAYGVYLVAVGALAVLALIIGFIYVVISESRKASSRKERGIKGERKVCPSCQAEVAATSRKCDNCSCQF